MFKSSMVDLEHLKHVIKLDATLSANTRILQLRLIHFAQKGKYGDTIPEILANHERLCKDVQEQGVMSRQTADDLLVLLYNHEIVQKSHGDILQNYVMENESSSSRTYEDDRHEGHVSTADISTPSMFWLQVATIAVGLLNTALLLYKPK